MFTIGGAVVVINKPWLRGTVVSITPDGRIEVDLGWEENWIFSPYDLESEERDDFWWHPGTPAPAARPLTGYLRLWREVLAKP